MRQTFCVFICWLAAIVTSNPVGAITATPAEPLARGLLPASCPGDCDGDGQVDIGEIVIIVPIILGIVPPGDRCEAADLNGDDSVSISELVAAVNAVLNGCEAIPTPTSLPADTFEPDDVADDAKPIACGAVQSRSIRPAEDSDWAVFSVDAPFTGVQIDAVNSNAFIGVTLHGDAGTILSDFFTIPIRECGRDALPAGRYRVHVSGFGAESAYQLHLMCTPCAQPNPTATPTSTPTAPPTAAPLDDFEPDDTRDAAVAIACGEVQGHSISPLGDADWLRFTVNEPYTSVLLQSQSFDFPLLMSLFAEDGTALEDGFTAIFRQCGLNALTAGEYRVRLQGELFAGAFGYGVALACASCDGANPTPIPPPTLTPTPTAVSADDFEPDDVAETGQPLGCGESQRHTLTSGDVDWVVFTLDDPFTDVRLSTGGMSSSLRLQTNAGTFVEESFFAPIARTCGVNALPAGTYRAAVAVFDRNGAYDFRLDCAPCDGPNATPTPTPTETPTPTRALADRFEPDDSRQSARSLRCGQFQEHTISATTDVDWLTFTVDEPNTGIVIEAITSVGRIAMRLEDRLGMPVESDFSFQRISRSCGDNALPADTYGLQVRGFPPPDSFSYGLFLVCASCDGPNATPTPTPSRTPLPVRDDFEPDDTRQQASLIACGEAQLRSFAPEGDIDWLSFGVDAPFTEIRVESFSSQGGVTSALNTADGTLLEQSSESIVRECGNDALPAGNYYLTLAPPFGRTDYRVHLTCVRCNQTNPTLTPTMTATPTPTPVPADTFEPDDSAEASKLLECGQLQRHTIAPAGEQDWLRLALTEPYTSVVVQTVDPTFTTSVSLLSTDGEFLDGGQNILRRCGQNALEAGDYRLLVQSFSFDQGSVYDVGLFCFPCDVPNPSTPTPFFPPE